MKRLPILLIMTAVSMVSFCQQKQPKKNIHVDTAGEVNVYGNGNVYIGKVIINPTLKTKIYLLRATQQKDTTGIYTTTFSFGNNETIPLLGVNLVFQFSDSILSAETGEEMAMGQSRSYDQGNTVFRLAINEVYRLPGGGAKLFEVIAKSRKPIRFSIYGIDGIMKNQ